MLPLTRFVNKQYMLSAELQDVHGKLHTAESTMRGTHDKSLISEEDILPRNVFQDAFQITDHV